MDSGEELNTWEFNMFAPGHAYSLASSGVEFEAQVNQSGYIPASVLDSLGPEGQKELPDGVSYEKDKEHLWSVGKIEGVSAVEMQQLREVLIQRKGTFAYSMKELPGYNGPPAEFQMVPNARAFHKPRNYSPLEEQIRDEKLQEQYDAGIIEEADTRSDFAACPTMPAKKDADGNWTDRRLCIDYRDANSQMITDNRPLPLPESIFRSLKDSKIFSKCDAMSAFMQIPLSAEGPTRKVTRLWWGNRLFQYRRLPYGIKNSVAIFQRIIETELERAGLLHCTQVFVDDIIIHSKTMAEHIQHVAAVLDALFAVGLRLHPAKSVFATDRIEYLGHMVTPAGLEPLAAKVAAMAQLPVPKNKDELRSALGLLNYYRCYIPAASTIAQPMNALLRKEVAYEWGPEQQTAFDALKAELCTPGKVLRQAREDRPFILHTDWCLVGIGAVLGQLDDQGNEFMVACLSRSLNKHERQYEVWKGELLAAVWGMKSFRIYLLGREFEICTDHRPLLWLLTSDNPTGQQARWVLAVQEFNFTIRHRPGVTNQNADVPSRFPLPSTADTTGSRLDSDGDGYTGPLPKVVFGPIGTGTPVQPYRVQESPQGLLTVSVALAFNLVHSTVSIMPPSVFIATIADLAVVTAARHDQYTYTVCRTTTTFDELQCHSLNPWEMSSGAHALAPLEGGAPTDRARQEVLRRQATGWVQKASTTVSGGVPSVTQQGVYEGTTTVIGIKNTGALCTASVSATFYTAAPEGVVLCELFGCICAGLEMVLRNGLTVQAYIYVDCDPVCQSLARHRIHQLMAQYPHLLPATAVVGAFTSLPQDVWLVTPSHLQYLSASLPHQWLVVGGWACQDLSPAGTCLGLHGDRSNTFFPMLQIIGTLQQLQQRLPPAYLIENTAFQHNWKSTEVSRTQFQSVCSAIGDPVCIDAAQFNSFAHRLRNYWTNLCDLDCFRKAVAQVTRVPNLSVQSILQPGRVASTVHCNDQLPHYVCNFKGKPLSAWPTIVAYRQSYAFLEGKQGAVWDGNLGVWSEPSAEECELAMGYTRGATAAPNVSEAERRAAMGRCMDMNVLQSILAISYAWFRRTHWAVAHKQMKVEIPLVDGPIVAYNPPQGVAAGLALGRTTHCVYQAYMRNIVLQASAEVTEKVEGKQALDVWEDAQLLYYLKEQQYQPGTSNAERTRVRKRSAFYVLAVDGRLFRILPDQSQKEVPKPEGRLQIISSYHEMGHYGVRRTAALVQTAYWWHGLLAEVANFISKCKLCSRVRSSFNAVHPTLHPLPICGMFYRVGVDLAGPFNKTRNGYLYVMIVIEHYSKYLDVIPLHNKEAYTTAAAFAQNVLGKYGATAEVLTDRGSEWAEEFATLLCKCLIDHRQTSPGHPSTDGLAERAVQTVKRALRKLCAAKGNKDDWDLLLPWVVLAYNCSPQKSTMLSPYMMMYARHPTIPPAIRDRLNQPLSFDDPEAAAADYVARSKLVQRLCVIAGDNLRIAQHRDTLRYAAVRSGSYLPKVRRFEIGDYVYLSRAPNSTLDIRAKTVILRVLEVRPTGVLVLQGRCGRSINVHSTNCAPCHLPDIDPRMDLTLAVPGEEVACEVCHSPDDGEYMLLCDHCNRGTHLYCCTPPYETVPVGTWVCKDCIAQGITAAQAEQQHISDRALEIEQQRADDLTPSEKKAKALHGRLVVKSFVDSSTKLPRRFWGRLSFVGPGQGDNLLVTYEDGDTETCTIRKMRNRGIQLMPLNSQLPEGLAIPDPVVAAVSKPVSTVLSGKTAVSLPSHWNLQTQQGVTLALNLLMPGEYATSHLTKLTNFVKACMKGEKGVWVPTAKAELEPLARSVDFSGCHSFSDPFAGAGSISAFFSSMGFTVFQNDLDQCWPRVQSHADAWQPAFYHANPAQVIVTSPPFGVLDVAAPLLAIAASAVACIHVPGHYITSATKPRQQWLHELCKQGRLHILVGLERGPMGRKCAFLLVFATADIKKQMLRVPNLSPCLSFAQT